MAALIVLMVLALILVSGAIWLTVQMGRMNTVYPGVTALGIDFSGMDRQQVNDALERIEKGTYGLCLECGKPIPQARLEAIPEAELCLNCADK